VIGGATGMTGAALLAARAGSSSVPGGSLPACCTRLPSIRCKPELMLRSPDEALSQATAIVAGPGHG
jgi:NAD(P)H-hydrate repair Nnr-like enzyme with NAD(P)H-hydrate dehydratase domain